ncbi:hypothetical protein EJB05_15883, partial [Eragrostis curvula]
MAMATSSNTNIKRATAAASTIILVHGTGHGGWCWYRVTTLLRAAGHRVHAPDLAASGADARPLRDVPIFEDYSRPLLDAVAALPDGARAVLVSHSFGGLSVALAAEMFPEKVAAAVFVDIGRHVNGLRKHHPSELMTRFLSKLMLAANNIEGRE